LTDDPSSFREALLNDPGANLSLFIVRKPHQHTDDALSLGRLRTQRNRPHANGAA